MDVYSYLQINGNISYKCGFEKYEGQERIEIKKWSKDEEINEYLFILFKMCEHARIHTYISISTHAHIYTYMDITVTSMKLFWYYNYNRMGRWNLWWTLLSSVLTPSFEYYVFPSLTHAFYSFMQISQLIGKIPL